MRFEAWVPNATGNISFSSVGTALTKDVRARAGFWWQEKRWIVCGQLRKNRDRLVPLWVLTVAAKIKRQQPQRVSKGLFYVLTAKSARAGEFSEGALVGQISILVPEDPGSRAGQAMMAKLAASLREAALAARKHQPFSDPDSYWQPGQDAIRSSSVFTCDFRMLRNGKCFFRALNNQGQPRLQESETEWLVDQCYYFLKDAVHHHYHHGVDTDAIIEVTRVPSGDDWRWKTQRNLYRKVISLRRNLDETRLSNALGVLAYANVFNSIFGGADFDREGAQIPHSRSLPVYAEELRASIEVRRDAAAQNAARRKTDAQFVVASIIALIALYVSMYQQLPAGSSAKILQDGAISLLARSPLLSIGLILIAFVVYSLYTTTRDAADFRIIRWIYRISAFLPRNILLIILTISCLAMLGGGAMLISRSVQPAKHSSSVSSKPRSQNPQDANPPKPASELKVQVPARANLRPPANSPAK